VQRRRVGFDAAEMDAILTDLEPLVGVEGL